MSSSSAISTPRPASRSFVVALCVILAFTALRLAVLAVANVNLYGDEAQYWSWAQVPAFGYYSKPPMIAWLIGATTALCGNGEFCVRAASPLIHAGTSLGVFVLARALYDARIAAWSAVTFVTLPAISLSALIISTDVPLLFFWALALLAFHRLLETRSAVWALALGLALGFGLLSKYAMIYFVLCAVLYGLTTRDARWVLTGRHGALALGVAGLLLMPNLLWNMHNGWPTFAHTAANANWTGSLFHPGQALAFLGSQLGVFGPILFAALAWRLARWRADPVSKADRFLLYFSIPVLALVLVQSFLSRAHANWAAPAYVGATILVVAWLAGKKRIFWMKTSLGLHVGVALIFYGIATAGAGLRLPDRLDPFLRLRGWDTLAGAVATRLEARPFATILTDDRQTMAELLYYLRGRSVPIAMWDSNGVLDNHYELTAKLKTDPGGPLLFVTMSQAPRDVLKRFRSARFVAPVSVTLGPDRVRRFYLYELNGFKGP